MVRNVVLLPRVSGALKRNLRQKKKKKKKTDDLPPQMPILTTVISIPTLFFTFSPSKLLCFAQQESFASDINLQ